MFRACCREIPLQRALGSGAPGLALTAVVAAAEVRGAASAENAGAAGGELPGPVHVARGDEDCHPQARDVTQLHAAVTRKGDEVPVNSRPNRFVPRRGL
jgi:hypothetical protein